MNLSENSKKQMKKWAEEITYETVMALPFASKSDYVRAYIKNSYDFVVKNFRYDNDLQRYLAPYRFDKEAYRQKYKEIVNLERFVQEGVGVCKQFASLLYILTANVKQISGRFTPELVNCKILTRNGKLDPHTCNAYVLDGVRYFCDPTMQESKKSRNFFFKTEQDFQREYNLAEGSKLSGQADIIEIKTPQFDKVCNMISDFKFSRNADTEDYKTSVINFSK